MPQQEEQAQDDSVKKRAFKRVAFAGALALVAAIGLTMMSRSNKPVPQPQPTVLPAEPMAALELQPEPQPVSAVAEILPETPPESDAPPIVAVAPPPPPQVINPPLQEAPRQAAKPLAAPSREEKPAARPLRSSSETGGKPPPSQELVATSKESVREALAKFNDAPAVRAVETRPATQKTVEAVQPPKPAPKAAERAPEAFPEKAPPPAPAQTSPAAGKGYAVQLGVFSNPDNATQMQEKLSQHGIKSYTETRLHVGPFHNRAEAEQARVKLRGLGISAVVVPLSR